MKHVLCNNPRIICFCKTYSWDDFPYKDFRNEKFFLSSNKKFLWRSEIFYMIVEWIKIYCAWCFLVLTLKSIQYWRKRERNNRKIIARNPFHALHESLYRILQQFQTTRIFNIRVIVNRYTTKKNFPRIWKTRIRNPSSPSYRLVFSHHPCYAV